MVSCIACYFVISDFFVFMGVWDRRRNILGFRSFSKRFKPGRAVAPNLADLRIKSTNILFQEKRTREQSTEPRPANSASVNGLAESSMRYLRIFLSAQKLNQKLKSWLRLSLEPNDKRPRKATKITSMFETIFDNWSLRQKIRCIATRDAHHVQCFLHCSRKKGIQWLHPADKTALQVSIAAKPS